MHRPTRDVDLLGYSEHSEAALANVFGSLCREAAPDDGLAFQADTVVVEPIRDDQEYGGQRVLLKAALGNARIELQIDVGFGDTITPGPESVTYPSLLGMEAPRLRAYPRETVVAEKLEALVKLGMANSRIKDFYDLYVMAQTFPFQGTVLRNAIAATFGRRGTAIPTQAPVALTDSLAKDETKRKQWSAFLGRSGLTAKGGELREIIEKLATFLVPPMTAAGQGKNFPQFWKPGGGGPLSSTVPRTLGHQASVAR